MRMWTKYKENQSYNNWIEYKRVCNRAVKEYKKAKWKFEKKLAKDIKNNPKAVYSYGHSKSQTKDTVELVMNSNGQLVDEDEQMYKEFNSYSASVFTREDKNVVLPETEKLF